VITRHLLHTTAFYLPPFSASKQWIACTMAHNNCFMPAGNSWGMSSDELSLQGVHNRFQTIVRAQLLVDVVQVVAQGLQADTQSLRDLR
jgi:hypothetical protein